MQQPMVPAFEDLGIVWQESQSSIVVCFGIILAVTPSMFVAGTTTTTEQPEQVSGCFVWSGLIVMPSYTMRLESGTIVPRLLQPHDAYSGLALQTSG